MTTTTNASLTLVSDEVEHLLEDQRKRLESIDTKSALALGFAGVLVALTGQGGQVLLASGRLTAAAAGIFALATVFPGRLREMIKPVHLADHNLDRPSERTGRYLVMLKSRWYARVDVTLLRRRRGLRIALAFLAISVTLIALGITLSESRGGVP